MSTTLAARRYAKALLSLARQQQTLTEVRADVNALQALLESSQDFHRFVTESIG
ncbi:MAG: F0F1 ATP synthase subunit delta, partial [Kiritimatiellae bacterium]|nr:F0F1 ATP synthase subunit delta [Kiritimatiellia bacterium]